MHRNTISDLCTAECDRVETSPIMIPEADGCNQDLMLPSCVYSAYSSI